MPPGEGDENRPDSEGDGAAAETGREASSPSRVQAVSLRWEAPLPPPALLERYDQVVPGLARQIAEQVKTEAGRVEIVPRTDPPRLRLISANPTCPPCTCLANETHMVGTAA